MRTPAAYPPPAYADPNDRRLVQIIKRAESAQAKAVNLIGVPFDGAILGRKGAAGGPSALRRAMLGFSTYSAELGVSLEAARAFDLGDVQVFPEDVLGTHAEVEAEVAGALVPDSLLIILGGDNSVSLPSMRACAKKYGRIGLIVIDSHLDLRGEIGGRPTSGSSYGLAVRELRGLDPRRVVEIGAHGFLNAKHYHDEAGRLGITVITAKMVRERGLEATAAEAYAIASTGADAVYLSVDIDAADLSYVSGVSAPSPGGLRADELSSLVYTLGRRAAVKCADIVELAPSLDTTGRSERVAADITVNLVAAFASRASGDGART